MGEGGGGSQYDKGEKGNSKLIILPSGETLFLIFFG